MGTVLEDLCTVVITARLFFLRMENFRTKRVEKIKTQILCSVTFFSEIVSFVRNCGKIW